MTDSKEETTGSAIHGVTIRLSTFWPDRPVVWFTQVEAQFEMTSVTRQRTKFNYVVSQLNQQQAAEVEDIIAAPPEHDSYKRLKAELIRRLSSSHEQRMRQLLSREEMGDRKPSQFLRHLKSLAPDVPDDFLRTIWASRLPSHVQAILAGQTDDSLESASHLADRICEVSLSPTAAGISLAAPDTTALLLERIEDLSLQVATLRQSQTHNRFRAHNHQRSSSCDRDDPNHSSVSQNICWYHWKFGDQARRCNTTCSLQQKDHWSRSDFHQSGNFPSRRQWRPMSALQTPAASSSQIASPNSNT